MIRTLFLSSLVCIFCMSASQFLFDSHIGEPQPSPDGRKCMERIEDILNYGCVLPTLKRWQINLTNPFENAHHICCATYDYSDCLQIAVQTPNKCNTLEIKAVNEYSEKLLAFYENGTCAQHTRRHEKCIVL